MRLIHFALVLTFGGALVLASCTTPPTPTPSATPTAEASPSPSATPAADHPTPRFGDGCDALVPEALVTPIFSVAVHPTDFLATEFAASATIPRYAPVAQLGGLLCEWSNGVPYSSRTGESEFRGMQLAVLPEADAGWSRFADQQGIPIDGDVVSCGERNCAFTLFVDGYWIEASVRDDAAGTQLPAVQALVAHLRSQASTWGSPSAKVTPESPVDRTCEEILPESVALDALGSGDPLEANYAEGPWSLYAEATAQSSGFGCSWTDFAARSAAVNWLDGGEWLAGELGASDGCNDFGCWTDLKIDGNWLRISAFGGPDPASGAARIAEHVSTILG
jgi:hypothetical protein